jgi:hypothetical protein
MAAYSGRNAIAGRRFRILIDGDDDRLDMLIEPTFSRGEAARFFEGLQKRRRLFLVVKPSHRVRIKHEQKCKASAWNSTFGVFLWSCVMPSIVPDDDTYIVLDDFGPLGRAWCETDEAAADRTTLVRNLLEGHYENPVRIVAFNTAEGWSRDVTVDIADELRRRRYVEYDEAPASLLRFLEAANRH